MMAQATNFAKTQIDRVAQKVNSKKYSLPLDATTKPIAQNGDESAIASLSMRVISFLLSPTGSAYETTRQLISQGAQ